MACRAATVLRYAHQDHLSGTSLTTTTWVGELATIKYLPFGGTRSQTGTLDTDKLFTGQRLDGTGLYFYNARYYDATIGRFISPDPIVSSAPLPRGEEIPALTIFHRAGEPSASGVGNVGAVPGSSRRSLNTQPAHTPRVIDPQEHNRYSYALNNPLRYVDPEGNQVALALAFACIPVWGWIGLGVVAAVYVGVRVEQETGFFSNTGTKVSKWWGGLFSSRSRAGSKSRAEHDKHKEQLDSMRQELKDLQEKLSRTKSAKERNRIQEDIGGVEKRISGHEKEMSQKWPDGQPPE